MTWEQVAGVFHQGVVDYLTTPFEQVVRRPLEREFVKVIRDLLLIKLGLE
jgi:response regulator of citrate/malate metabolism